MNTHDIELPPLPSPFGIVDPMGSGEKIYTLKDMGDYARAYARAAIEADRKNTAEMLKNPVHVHINMCRGIIAPITFDQLAHVLGDEATEAWLADRQRRKPQHINPELKAATEYAATTRSPVAITKDGRGQQGDVADRRD